MARKNERRIQNARKFRRNHDADLGNRGLEKETRTKVVDKATFKIPKGEKVISVPMPKGTTTDNVNFFRYIRWIAVKEIIAMEYFINGNKKDIPVDEISLAVMDNLLEDVEDLITSQVDSVLIDMGFINFTKEDL